MSDDDASGGGGGSGSGGDGERDESERSAAPIDASTRRTVQRIPLLTKNAGPRDPAWLERQKEELQALIRFIQSNKDADNDWFTIESNREGTVWTGKCWYFYRGVRYTFDFEINIPVAYPKANPDILIPELRGKTAKMFREGQICLEVHFMPLWARNAPRFGIAHALALGLAPWLAAEVPHLVEKGAITASA